MNPFRTGKAAPISKPGNFKDIYTSLLGKDNGAHVKHIHGTNAIGLNDPEDYKHGAPQYPLLVCHGDHVPTGLLRGFATKPFKRNNRKYTKDQLSIIKWFYMRGVRGPHGGDPAYKYSADRAAFEMPLHGTTLGSLYHPGDSFWNANAAGKPTFGVRELLSHWVLKQWFSNTSDSFNKAWNSASKKCVASLDFGDVDTGVDDMDDM